MSALPNIHERQALQALLYSAGIDMELENQLDFGLPAAQFFPLLVKTLDDYGTLADDRHPIAAVLQTAKRSVGKELQATCERLIQEIDESLSHYSGNS